MARRVLSLELAFLLLSAGCQNSRSENERARAPNTSTSASLQALLAPPRAGRFTCEANACVQLHPRLPDSGEWRCADTGNVVWCAGGEPAAGVAPGLLDPGYRCGARWGGGPPERVCIDEHPDYPDSAEHRSCSFSQERGIARVCKPASSQGAALLLPGALAACWLGKDCRSGRCDRGTCRCEGDSDCEIGRCQRGVCAEAKR